MSTPPIKPVSHIPCGNGALPIFKPEDIRALGKAAGQRILKVLKLKTDQNDGLNQRT